MTDSAYALTTWVWWGSSECEVLGFWGLFQLGNVSGRASYWSLFHCCCLFNHSKNQTCQNEETKKENSKEETKKTVLDYLFLFGGGVGEGGEGGHEEPGEFIDKSGEGADEPIDGACGGKLSGLGHMARHL